MIDQSRDTSFTVFALHAVDGPEWRRPRLFRPFETFTRSNGTVVARIYERLTKASRRREPNYRRLIAIPGGIEDRERAYRKGVYDAFTALQEELEN